MYDASTHVSERRVWRSESLDEDGSAAVWNFLLPVDDWLRHSKAFGNVQVRSAPFRVGKAQWRLMCILRNGAIGVYLECETAKDKQKCGDNKWGCFVHFRLQVVQRGKPASEAEVSNRDTHRFTGSSSYWGFEQMLLLEKLDGAGDALLLRARDKQADGIPQGPFGDGYEQAVHVRVTIKDTSLERDFLESDAPADHPVGLRNQGATCYLNSVLQMLFHLCVFRQAVYQLPVQFFVRSQEKAGQSGDNPVLGDDFRKTLPFALAKLFWGLQTQRTAVSTTCLTDSFGWARGDALEQHDVQELLRKLIDNLEEKMKETSLKGFIDSIILGRMRNYVKCTQIEFESERTEDYKDIQVTVRGKGSLEEALRSQLDKEELVGDNKYHACDERNDHGMQDARKGMEWQTFPPVVMLHLRRFEYDWVQDTAVKINDRFAFPEELDMGPYLNTESGPAADDDGPRQRPYVLHSVLVHSGTVGGGHYYAFVRVGEKGWYKFDDDRVTSATRTQAVTENFGGRDADRFWLCRANSEFSTSAYMLVYVDERRWAEASRPTEQLPKELHAVFRNDAEEEAKRKQEREEAHLFYDVEVCTEEDFRRYDDECPLHVDLKPRDWKSERPLRVRRAAQWHEFQAAVARHISEDADRPPGGKARLLHWLRRDNATERPFGPLTTHRYIPRDAAKSRWRPLSADTIVDHAIRPRQPAVQGTVGVVQLYADYGPPVAAQEVVVFVKVFEPSPVESKRERPGRVRYLGSLNVHPRLQVADLKEMISQAAGRPAGSRVALWEEVRLSLVVPLDDSSATLATAMPDLSTGDIVLAQFDPDTSPGPEPWRPPPLPPSPRLGRPVPTGAEASYDERAAELRGPELAFYWLLTGRDVTVIDKDAEAGSSPSRLSMHINDSYRCVLSQIAAKVGCPDTHIRLHRATYSGSLAERDSEIRDDGHQQLSHMLTPAQRSRPGETLYFERLSMALSELRTLLEVRVTHELKRPGADGSQRVVKCVLPTSATAADVKRAVMADLSSEAEDAADTDPSRVRLLRLVGRRIDAVVEDQHNVSDALAATPAAEHYYYGQDVSLRSEVAPVETGPAADAQLVSVCHYHMDKGLGERAAQWPIQHYHSTPILCPCVEGENRDQFLERVAGLLGIAKVARVQAWKLTVLRRSPGGREFVARVVEDGDDVLAVVRQESCKLEAVGADVPLPVGVAAFSVFLGLEHRPPPQQSTKGIEIKG
eukprot:TRINITY_DN7301_c0_g3_i1.p1 TRINITY_DN7301_c0_g3~~TRINITY_DN7301_c0_g3_i1.p1  ORF type:complete len:1250 (+),score=425.49 TRINITY_DN7301_c0_g3_i1:82-3750(+)